VFKDDSGKEVLEEQGQVIIDMMQRVAYSDWEETLPDPAFETDVYGKVSKKRGLVGMSIVTIHQARQNGWAQITIRQPVSFAIFNTETSNSDSLIVWNILYDYPREIQAPTSTSSFRTFCSRIL